MTELLGVSASDYHADEVADRPTLSKSIIQTLLERSPAHAWAAHPRLNPNFQRTEEDRFDLGTAAHQLFLEGTDAVAVCPFDDWRTAAAKEAKLDARIAGRIPMLASQYADCRALVDALHRQCDNHPAGPFFCDGLAEATLVWEERGVLCRARLDWLLDDHTAIHDLKTTSRSANPETWCRSTLWSIGADLQQALYVRGCQAVLGVEPEFRFVVVETEPPYAVSVISVDPIALAVANRKIDWALDLWRGCLERDEWPAYDPRVHYAEMPPWVENAWLIKEASAA